MNLKEAQDAAGEGREVEITKGEDKGFRGTAVRVITLNGKHWMHVNSRTTTRYSPLFYTKEV